MGGGGRGGVIHPTHPPLPTRLLVVHRGPSLLGLEDVGFMHLHSSFVNRNNSLSGRVVLKYFPGGCFVI